MSKELDFNCDRQAKCDFTASTTSYLHNNYGYVSSITWYEKDEEGNIVPFGSPSASTTTRQDVFLNYGSVWYAIELKERDLCSYARFLVEEGSFLNEEKVEPLMETGMIPLWSELYTDGVIRIWNLRKIKPTSLRSTTKMIKTITIDPNARKKPQNRLLLPINKAKEIKRIRGDEQGDS